MKSDRSALLPSTPLLLTDPRLVAVLFVQAVGLFGMNVPPPALADMAVSLSVTDSEIALVMTVFSIPAIVIAPIVGVLADILGRRNIILGSLLLLSGAGIAVSFVNNLTVVLILRAIQGVGFAGTTPLTVAVIGDLFSGEEGSTAQGYRMSASGVVLALLCPRPPASSSNSRGGTRFSCSASFLS